MDDFNLHERMEKTYNNLIEEKARKNNVRKHTRTQKQREKA